MLTRDRGHLKLFAGNSNVPLAKAIAEYVGIDLGAANVGHFTDGEVLVEIEESVRGTDVYILQSTCKPVNDNLMEMLVIVDALKRASAGSITAVVPYYGYARQDRKVAPRAPISAKLVADLLAAAGIGRVISVDMHAGQIQGFFNIPFDHIYAAPVLLKHLAATLPEDREQVVIVSPDAGGVERAAAYAKRIGCSIAIMDKRRERPGLAQIMHVIGEVKDKTAVILDDMIDTAGTLTAAAHFIKEAGARKVIAASTHAVLSGPAVQRIVDGDIEEVLVTDTIQLNDAARASGKFNVLSISSLLGEAIRRIHTGDSVSQLFK